MIKKAKAAEMPPVDLAGAQTVIQHEHYGDNLYIRLPAGGWGLVWRIFSEDELKGILESHRSVDGIFFDVKR